MPYPSIPSRPERVSPSPAKARSSLAGRRAARLLRKSRPAFGVVALGLAIVLGSPGRARSAEPETEQQARALYQAGNEAFSAGRYQEAYRQWEEGYQLSARPLFLVNMAHAERRRGELDKARVLYQRFLLVEPQSPLRAEVEAVIAEINAVLPTGGTPQAAAPPVEPTAQMGASPPPASPEPLDLTPPAVTEEQTSAPPLRLESAGDSPLQEASRPIYRKWWFWTAVGTVVATAAVVGVLATRQEGAARNGSLGTLGTPP